MTAYIAPKFTKQIVDENMGFLRCSTAWPASTAVRGYFLAVVLSIFQPRSARGDEGVGYKFQSWQEEHDRIRVDSHYVLAEKDIDPNTKLKAMGLIDSIAGATPTGETPRTPDGPSPVAQMKDVRRACSVDLSRQFNRLNVDAAYAVSRESDYLSKGWSINTTTDFNQRNTGLLVGYGRMDDTIKEPKLGWSVDRYKTGDDFIVGVKQLVNADTAGTLNVSYGQMRGFLSDPYKIVSTTKLDLDPGFYYTPPENRPREKDKLSVALALNRNFKKLNGALDASYRYYRDTFGIRSNTINVTWIQEWGERFIIQPSIRLSRQSAADFYHHDLDAAGVVTTFDPVLGETGTGRAPFYSSDYRVSKMQTIDVGLKLVWKMKPWLWMDVACNRYAARGLDRVTPGDVYGEANNFTVGLKFFR